MEPLLTLEQAAKILVVSVNTVRRRINEGKLRAVKEGSQVRIEPDDLRNYRALLPPKKCRKPVALSADHDRSAGAETIDLVTGG